MFIEKRKYRSFGKPQLSGNLKTSDLEFILIYPITVITKNLGNLIRRISLFDVHWIPKRNLMLFRVPGQSLLIFPLSRSDPQALVLPANRAISVSVKRWYLDQERKCSISSLSEFFSITLKYYNTMLRKSSFLLKNFYS